MDKDILSTSLGTVRIAVAMFAVIAVERLVFFIGQRSVQDAELDWIRTHPLGDGQLRKPS